MPSPSQSLRCSFVADVIERRRYECRPGDHGLVFVDQSNNDTPFEADVLSYLPLTTPKLTKRGMVAVHQPHVTPKPSAWWKAQCGFRGLLVGGTVAVLQQRLRDHGQQGLSPQMQERFAKLEQQYNEQIWNRLDDDDKASALPHRFLSETFSPDGSRHEEVLVVSIYDQAESLQAAAKSLGVACEVCKWSDSSADPLMVVLGCDALQVRSKCAEYQRQEARAVQREKPRMTARRSKPFTTAKKETTSATAKDKPVTGSWNVKGRWEIRCPYIEEEWGDESRTLELTIGNIGPDGGGLVQIYAEFDFVVFTGILRLVEPTSKTGSEFGLKRSSLPSSKQKSFNFRWRGETAEEGEIQLGSDEELCPIVFESPDRLHGVFVGNAVGKQRFTGVRLSSQGAQINPDHLWSQRDASAYEQARKCRWH